MSINKFLMCLQLKYCMQKNVNVYLTGTKYDYFEKLDFTCRKMLPCMFNGHINLIKVIDCPCGGDPGIPEMGVGGCPSPKIYVVKFI